LLLSVFSVSEKEFDFCSLTSFQPDPAISLKMEFEIDEMDLLKASFNFSKPRVKKLIFKQKFLHKWFYVYIRSCQQQFLKF
jgi:hypothetical protein